MNIYVASSLENYEKVLEVEAQLQEKGYTITHSWATVYKRELAGEQTVGDLQIALDCESGVVSADAVVLLTINKSRGAHIEFGIAIGAKIPVYILCPDEEYWISFYTLGQHHRALSDLLHSLEYYKSTLEAVKSSV